MAGPQTAPAVETYAAPDTGAQYASTGGKVWLTKGGKFYSADPSRLDEVYGQLGEGARPATAEEVAFRLRQKELDTTAGKVGTVVDNIARGALNVAAAPARNIALALGDDSAAKMFTAESFFKDEAGLRELISSGSLKGVDKAERKYVADTQARDANFPTLAAVSKTAGEIGAVVATGGLAAAPELIAGRSLPSAALRVGAASGAENALLSTAQETGSAALENRGIDRERLAADGLSAAILGAALGGGGVVLGRGVSALKSKLLRGASADGAGEAARAAEIKRGAPSTVEESLGATRADAATAAEGAGVNPIARAEAAEAHATQLAEKAAAADPSDWRAFTRDSNAIEQYVHRDAVIDGATRDAADDLNKVLERQKPVYDEIDNFTAKREKVAEHIAADGVDETALLSRAQEETGSLRGRIDDMRAEIEAQRAANTEIPEAIKKVKKNSADSALDRASFVVRQAEKNLAKAESGADGVVAVDSMRRELAKVWRQARQSLQQTAGLEERMALEPVRDFLRSEYQRAADSLMDASFVGQKQAAAQSAVNKARVGAINGEQFDLRGFTTQVGSKEGADFGGQVFGANRDALRSLLSEIQPGPAARLKTEQFERFLATQKEVFDAIKGNYSLTPGNAKKLDELLGSVDRLRGTLDSAREASGKVNQAKALIDADNVGGEGIIGRAVKAGHGAFTGGISEGAGGAVRGFARGLMGGTENVVAMRQRYAALAESHDNKVASGITSWIDRLIKGGGGAGKEAGKKGGRKFLSDETRAAFSKALPEEKTMLGGALGVSPGLRRFMSEAGDTRAERRELLQERRQQLAELITNPARIQKAAETVLGGSAQYMPGMSAQMVAETVERLTKLHERLGGSSKPTLLPAVKQPEMVSDQELHAQDAMVQATLNPMSVFTDFAQGKVDPIKTAFVREMYPQIWAQAQAASLDALSRVTKMPSTQSLTQIDLFLGLNGTLEPSLAPDFLARQVERSKLAEAQDKPVAPSARKAPNIASNFATTSQRLGTS